MDGTTTLGAVIIDNANAASFSTNALAAGSHALTAVFGGDSSDAGSASVTLTPTVNQ
jgi:hypothetical protein